MKKQRGQQRERDRKRRERRERQRSARVRRCDFPILADSLKFWASHDRDDDVFDRDDNGLVAAIEGGMDGEDLALVWASVMAHGAAYTLNTGNAAAQKRARRAIEALVEAVYPLELLEPTSSELVQLEQFLYPSMLFSVWEIGFSENPKENESRLLQVVDEIVRLMEMEEPLRDFIENLMGAKLSAEAGLLAPPTPATIRKVTGRLVQTMDAFDDSHDPAPGEGFGAPNGRDVLSWLKYSKERDCDEETRQALADCAQDLFDAAKREISRWSGTSVFSLHRPMFLIWAIGSFLGIPRGDRFADVPRKLMLGEPPAEHFPEASVQFQDIDGNAVLLSLSGDEGRISTWHVEDLPTADDVLVARDDKWASMIQRLIPDIMTFVDANGGADRWYGGENKLLRQCCPEFVSLARSEYTTALINIVCAILGVRCGARPANELPPFWAPYAGKGVVADTLH